MTRPQPYRLDFHSSGDLTDDERQLGTVVESADTMFEILFTDLRTVEALIQTTVDTALADDTLTPAAIAALIAAAVAALEALIAASIAAAPRYSVLTNGYAPDPELVFVNGDVIDVRVA